MGTPDFSVPTLQKLKENGHEVALVITQEDKRRGRGKQVQFTPVKEKAIELGIEVYQPSDVNSEESVEKLSSLNPDAIVVVAYGQILREEILNMPKYGCINVHASLLPKYRGAAPINWVIIDGEAETGVTIMQMAKGLDTGDMMEKASLKIPEDMTAGELHDRLMDMGADLLIKTLDKLERGEIVKEEQDDSASSYAHMMDKGLGKIDWSKSSRDIFNLIRGTQPWPGTYFNYDDKVIKVRRSSLLQESTSQEPGTIIDVSKDGIKVATGDGVILLEEIQIQGKRWMTVEEFLRGNTLEKLKLN